MSDLVVNGTTPDTFLLPPNCAHEQWCLDLYGYVNYLPNIASNAFFLAAFTIGLIAQIALGIRYRAWSFTGPMMVGILLETVGYGGRIGMHNNVFINTWFIMYLCCLTIGPALFSAAIYFSLSRIITIFSNSTTASISLLRPRTITILFIACDFLSLLLQAIGGALASVASTPESRDVGVNIMVAGLSTQVAATTSFAALCLHLAWRIRRHPERVSPDADLTRFRATKRFRFFLGAIAIAVLAILVRCAFRVAELSEGFGGDLANDETLFMVFDSAMMVVCVVVLECGASRVESGWAVEDGGVSLRKRKGRAGGTGEEMDVVARRESEKRSGAVAVGSGSETPSENGALRV